MEVKKDFAVNVRFLTLMQEQRAKDARLWRPKHFAPTVRFTAINRK